MNLPLIFLVTAASAATSYIATPATAALARRIGAIDCPDGGRKRHARATPRLGGLALLVGLALSLLFLPTRLGAILSGACLIAAVGVCDDVYSLPPTVKLVCQSAAAAIPLAFGLSLGGDILSNAASLVWIVALTNAFNMIDGSDGLAASQGALSGALTAALLLAARLVGAAPAAALPAAVAALALSAACVGFLPHNRESARVFLGDSGSMLIGFSLATIPLAGGENAAPAVALGANLLPIAELAATVIRRAVAGRRLFSADRGHLHHILADAGLSPRAIAALQSLASLAIGCAVLTAMLLAA